jgi:carotenoid 1,2-hydratase
VRIVSGFEESGWHDQPDSGAYEWWYYDAVAADGRTALVLIWFAGLPFSPDYLTDHERGRRPRALDHTALFAAVYRDGRQIAYALNRHHASDFDASRNEPNVRVGQSEARWNAGAGRFELSLDIPLLLGGDRLEGALCFTPTVAADALGFGPGNGSDAHVWNPIAPSCDVAGEIFLRQKGETARAERFRGRGYVDHNYGSRPLTEGIERWHWGRAHFDETTVVYYHNEPHGAAAESVLAAVGPEVAPFHAGEIDFTAASWRRRPLCPRFPGAVAISGKASGTTVRLEGRVRSILDWGPFYMRFLTDYSGEVAGRRVAATGISEYLDPRGLRLRILRPLIKTRIQSVSRSPATSRDRSISS